MKRTIVILLALLLVMSALVACGGEVQQAVEEAAPTIEAAVEEVAPTVEAAVEEVAPTVEAAVEEAVAEVEEAVEEVAEEVAELDPAAMDEGFATFLAGMDHYNTIGIEDLNLALAEDPPPFILDVREPGELEEKGHIEGAVNIPLREVLDNPALLPSFDTPIVSYCGSGWRCTIALTALEALGWENVKGLTGGSYGGWVEAGYPTKDGAAEEAMELNAADPDPALLAAMQEMLHNVPEGFGVITADDLNIAIAENPDLILIDVRTPGEVEEKGYIDAPNVLFIPLEDFIADKDQWPADLDAPIVTYCGSGHRSTIAMSILWANGYTDVHSLKGGYGGWVEAGYATVGAPEMEETAEEGGLNAGFATFLAGMEAYNTIGLDDLNLALAEDPPPFLLDVREPGELEEKGHIEGAVNIPLREVADNLQYMPSFDTPIVSYCGSGWRCTIALTILEGMGWENVKGLKGGSLGGWIEAGYPVIEGAAEEPLELNAAEVDPALVAAAQETLQNVPEGFGGISADDLNIAISENPDLILIDVRTPGEVAEKGAIDAPNVLFIPLEDFIADKDQWPADLDAPIVAYCGSGHRSTIAMSILWANGYTDVHSLKGGYGGWVEAGYPTVEGAPAEETSEGGAADLDAAFATFLADMEAYNTIGLDDLNLALAEDPPPFLLDVREPAELEENGHIEGAVNIPLREVADNIQYLPSFDTPIVSYCGSGWRCTIALAALEAMGWEDVKGLKGSSFGGWVEAGYPFIEGAAEEPLELNVAGVDPALLASMQEMLNNVPEGFGVITADDLNIAIAENPELILIDVRTPGEVAEKGAIDAPNVLFIPLEEFIAMSGEWPADLDAPIVTYCGSGHRSTIAMAILWSYGYSDVHSLKGGFNAWTEAGYPVVEVEAQ